MPRELGTKIGPHFYCDADKDYWKELKQKFANKPPSICYKRTTSVYGEDMWVVEGRGTARHLLQDSLVWYCPIQNRYNIGHGKCRGFRALDICSSYGVSSRAFLEHHHRVDIIEPEEFMASLVACNSRIWKVADRMHVMCRQDFDAIQFSSYDSVRIGTNKLAYILMECPDIYNVKNIVLDFAIGDKIKESIIERGYEVFTRYSASTHSFTRA
jgi:hypothetical protein